MMDKKEFVKKIAALSMIYGKKEELANELLLDMYYATISKNLTQDEFDYAVNQILQTRKYGNFPTPAEFIEIVKGSQEQREKLCLVEAQTKFEEILKSGRSIKCDDWAIHSVIVKMGGLDEIRRTEKDQVKWLVKEFSDKYKVEKSKKKVDYDIPVVLLTKRDRQQQENKLTVLPAKLIGDNAIYEKWSFAIENKKQNKIGVL